MSKKAINYGTSVGIFNEGNDVRLDLGLDVTSSLTDSKDDKPTTRFIIKKLDDLDFHGEVLEDDVVGIFTEDDRYRVDIGEYAFASKVDANHVSETTVLTIECLGAKTIDPIRYGDVVGIFTSDHKYRLDIGTPPLKRQMASNYDSWATRLRIRQVQSIHPSNPSEPPLPPIPLEPPKPPEPPAPDVGKPVDPAPQQQLTTLERIFVGVYEGVKRAQVDVQRGAHRKFDWFFPENENKVREARTLDIPIPTADGTVEIRKIPLFSLVPHHDLMIDSVTVKMKVDLLQLTRSDSSPEINEIESTLARTGDSPALFADIEIHLKGTDPVEGVARLNDEIVKRF